MDPFIGEIRLFGFNFPPKGWAVCSGQLLPIAQNTALFSILGTQYGGDGRSNFALPNLNGRAALGTESGPGLTPRNNGDVGGAAVEALTAQEMAAHTHSARAQASNTAAAYAPPQNVWSSDAGGDSAYGLTLPQVQMASDSLAQAGANQPHNNLQPYLVLNYCIALQGVFPARG